MGSRILSLLIGLAIFSSQSFAQTPLAANGKLKLGGTKNLQLVSECGNPVQLRGVSSHDLMSYENCFTETSFIALKEDWKADVIRIAVYTRANYGYASDRDWYKERIDYYVNVANDLGMYAVIDWHVLDPGNPNTRIDEAKEFWGYISETYKNYKNVIYEICNEPNGVDWSEVKKYANVIIPLIRKNDPSTVIILGTPFWSGYVWNAASDPITGSNAFNLMYAFHFYAATHGNYMNDFKKATATVPIFASEWGTSQSSGTGSLDLNGTEEWTKIFNGNNDGKVTISWCNWSFSDKNETSAALKEGSCLAEDWNNVTPSGEKVKYLISNPAKNFIPCTATKPVINTQPQAASVKSGASATFSVSAGGSGTLTYKWQKSADGTSGWTDITNATSTSYSIPSVTAADAIYYRVVVTNAEGSTTSSSAKLTIVQSQPYGGTAANIPGTIEAEKYDLGGPEIGYHDATEVNSGGAFRTDQVDIEACTDSLGGYNVGYIAADEWMDYSINVALDGPYDFYFRVASTTAGKTFKVLVDDQVIIPTVTVPNTGSWTKYTFVRVPNVNLKKTNKRLRFQAITNDFNFNYILVKNSINSLLDNEDVGAGIEIYPNPFEDKFSLISATNESMSATVFDAIGNKVMETSVKGEGTIQLMQNQPSGVYYLQLRTASGTINKKIVKK